MRLLSKLVLAVAATVALMVALPAAAQTKLKWAHVYETSEPFHRWSVWAAGEIEKRTNGRYHIDVFPASSLGKESDINQGLTLGTVDMIISGLSFAARTMPRFGVGYYPYTFRDGDHLIKWAKSDAFKQLADEYRQKTGIQVTAMTYYGTRHTTSNRAFTDCTGMKGLKMRVPESPIYVAAFKQFGATMDLYPNPTPPASDMSFFFRFLPGIDTGEYHHYFHTDLETPQTVPWTGLEASTRAYAKIIDEVNKLPLSTFQRPEEPQTPPAPPAPAARR